MTDDCRTTGGYERDFLDLCAEEGRREARATRSLYAAVIILALAAPFIIAADPAIAMVRISGGSAVSWSSLMPEKFCMHIPFASGRITRVVA